MWKSAGPCPVFESFTLAFALQLRKRTENPQVKKTLCQSTVYINITKTPTQTHITKHTHTHTHTHTLQNNVKPRQVDESWDAKL